MKKLLFLCVAFAATLLFTNTTKAQAVKIGYFDETGVLGLFSDINKVDTLMDIYRTDSLGQEYQYRLGEYQKADSAYKKDSATLPAKARELAERDLLSRRYYLVNWQQISQEMLQNKTDQLLDPYRKRILAALTAIVAENKYTLVLNANTLSPYVQPPVADNLSIRVALRLKLPIAKEAEEAFKAATGGSAKPAGAKQN